MWGQLMDGFARLGRYSPQLVAAACRHASVSIQHALLQLGLVRGHVALGSSFLFQPNASWPQLVCPTQC